MHLHMSYIFMQLSILDTVYDTDTEVSMRASSHVLYIHAIVRISSSIFAQLNSPDGCLVHCPTTETIRLCL